MKGKRRRYGKFVKALMTGRAPRRSRRATDKVRAHLRRARLTWRRDRAASARRARRRNRYLLPVAVVAARLGVTPQTVYNWRKSMGFPLVRIGTLPLVDLALVRRLLVKRTKRRYRL